MKPSCIHRLCLLFCLLSLAAECAGQAAASFTPVSSSRPDYPPCTFQREQPTAFVFSKNNSISSATIGESIGRNTVVTLTADLVRTRSIVIRKNAHVRIVGGKSHGMTAIVDGRTDDNRLLRNGDAYTKAVGSRDVFTPQISTFPCKINTSSAALVFPRRRWFYTWESGKKTRSAIRLSPRCCV